MGLPVAGQYTGKLDDGGEQVRVSNILGTSLIEFTFDNLAPWPVEAAGSGSSLVLTAPGVSPEHNDSSSWAASGVAGGTPGQENVISFDYADWAAANAVTNPGDDDDGDGLTNFDEFVRGTSPLALSVWPLAGGQMKFLEVGGVIDACLTYSFTYSLAAQVTTTVEFSRGLKLWDSGPGFTAHLRTIFHGDGTATATWRSATPASFDDRQFMRAVFSAR